MSDEFFGHLEKDLIMSLLPVMSAKKNVPFDFVLDRLLPKAPRVRLMFGCSAVYIGPKIVFILRDRKTLPQSNGVWIATSIEHHESLKEELPSIRAITALGSGETEWQVIPVAADDFESSAIRACELVLRNDPRIGKIPRSKKNSKMKRKSLDRRSHGGK